MPQKQVGVRVGGGEGGGRTGHHKKPYRRSTDRKSLEGHHGPSWMCVEDPHACRNVRLIFSQTSEGRRKKKNPFRGFCLFRRL